MSGKKRVEKTVWVPVEGLGFEILVRYLPRNELTRMLERATETTWDRKAAQNVDRIVPAKLLKEYAGVILDWRGLTREIYARLIPIEPLEYPEEIPCTEEYKLELLEEAYGFDAVVRQICTDLTHFENQRQEDEVKNS